MPGDGMCRPPGLADRAGEAVLPGASRIPYAGSPHEPARLSGSVRSTVVRAISAHQVGIHDPTLCLARFSANALDIVNDVL
jgi:hypothetical protein